ncbi:hypothetical protein D9757_001558 [Collybiopsis confluens]|uniref:Uncharacterized protein n=1 Tax=Collybiopsis confluens TaxID=2823264 RepID=A0A8H5HZG8_9AGAR|nr:hypothetical protein D9757_001558 [Collybiopsis confluens]
MILRHRKELKISLPSTATNAELAKEVAKTFDINIGNLRLEVDGGFQLREQDSIMSIEHGEVVIARVSEPSVSYRDQNPLDRESLPAPDSSTVDTQMDDSVTDVPTIGTEGRKILFVSPEQARRCANAFPTGVEEPNEDFGTFAFEGGRVGSQVTLKSLKIEAARILDLDSDYARAMDSDKCTKCKQSAEETCACAIASEIIKHGLLSSMHCRLTIDGSECPHGKNCPYSHAPIALNTRIPPHCTICEGALGFPCKICEAATNDLDAAAHVHCPLVSNAGCGHLHHAHCLGLHLPESSKMPRPKNCPSGCAGAQFPFEQRIFRLNQPHVILVWDGPAESKIMYIPIPEDKCSKPLCQKAFQIEVSVLITIVREHLLEQKTVVPDCGLTVWFHGRDPVHETVLLTQTALVSVCATSYHDIADALGRFTLFASALGYVSKKQSASISASIRSAPNTSYTQVQLCDTIDFHTSAFPVFSTCDCTTLGELQLVSAGESGISSEPLILYVVQRAVANKDASLSPARGKTTFLDSPAWHPNGLLQTPRGIACLLSSLYVMAESVAHGKTRVQGTRNVLSMMYMIGRFPPAVRALDLIIKNINLLPEEQAALSSTIYYALKAFSYDAPSVIVNNDKRTFEASRILLAWILAAADAASTLSGDSAVEHISLVCASSGGRLRDPVQWGSSISERAFAMLHLPGSPLYRPLAQDRQFVDLKFESLTFQAIRAGKYLPQQTSLSVLRVDRIGRSPPSFQARIEITGRGFHQAIVRANNTELATRGPLDLKAPAIVPPQLVLDPEGLIAVFTGRGCGSTRDVNFFRPTASGDTAVDINDVAIALEQVIPERKKEQTWEIDSYTGIGGITRDPEEAIVLCLDLSESMRHRSGVEDGRIDRQRQEEARRQNVDKRIEKLTSGLTEDQLRSKARLFLDQNIDWSARVALRLYWEFLDQTHHNNSNDWMDVDVEDGEEEEGADESDSEEDEDDGEGRWEALARLRNELEVIARRDIMNRVDADHEDDEDEDEDPLFYTELAAFAKMCQQKPEHVKDYIYDELVGAEVDGEHLVGSEPFNIPRKYIDPKTGNILEDPCRPRRAPYGVYVSRSSLSWFDDEYSWPKGLYIEQEQSQREVKMAISEWISGRDLLTESVDPKEAWDLIFVHQGKTTSWKLDPATTTRTLYSLVNRAVGGAYTSFSLTRFSRVLLSSSIIPDSKSATIEGSGLADGGRIEITRAVPHTRASFILSFDRIGTRVVLPFDASNLALFALLQSYEFPMSDTTLWHGQRAGGDGAVYASPTSASFGTTGTFFSFSKQERFRCAGLHVSSSAAEKSRYLTRLHLLTELFNVFINRACSFDTRVPLVLGLVTFSDKAKVAQALTPLFEKFREQLNRATAGGDTAVYDALDLARSMLVHYRTDLLNLRRRIIMVSDGQDTSSTESPLDVLAALQRGNIVVDSVQVGPSVDAALHGISVVTGGYRFCPRTSLSDALSIFDLETVLNSGERPTPTLIKAPLLSLFSLRSIYGNTSRYPVDVVTLDEFPKRAEHAKLFNKAKVLEDAPTQLGLTTDDRLKRIMLEIHRLMKKTPNYADIYVDDSDITFLRIVMEAPNDEGCLYRNGIYLLTCDFPESYPRDAPQIRFVNFIMHPNVSKQGKVCIAELGRLWSSDMNMETVLHLVYQIFTHPDLENPLETQSSMRYYDDTGEYAFAVAQAVSTHASKTRAEWRMEMEDR